MAVACYTNLNRLCSLTGQSDPSFVQAHPCRCVRPEPAKPRKLPEVTRRFSLLLRVGSGDEIICKNEHVHSREREKKRDRERENE